LRNHWPRSSSLYSPRPKPRATVSAPLTWKELEDGAVIEDFRIDNMPQRIAKLGDLWAPLNAKRGRFDLTKLL
jgi:bifunctional non-homologous end joining protein LigD